MHLRAIKLRGFKSFPDPVEVRLERGVAVVVGPNGSGKSNVSDALLWASGSLSPSELRAEKPDDVLFAGAAGRPAADWCEVELLFDNADGQFTELEFSEIAITRRLHRGGEGQYLVNKATVRRTDLVELLADVGLGGGHSSVIGQGRVEEILSSKPEQRRALLEEAAALYRLRSAADRLELRREAAVALAERLRAEPLRLPTVDDEQLRTTRERLSAVERALAEREGLPPAARALAEQGARLALSELEVEPGRERAVAAALGPRGSALLADDVRTGLALLEEAHAAGLGNLPVLVGARPAELVERYAVVPRAELLNSRVPAVTTEGFGYDPERGELWFAGETAEAVWLELEARRRALAAEVQRLQENPAAPPPVADPRLVAAGVRLVRALAGASEAGRRFEAPLRARVDAGGSRTGDAAGALRELAAREAELRRGAADAGERD